MAVADPTVAGDDCFAEKARAVFQRCRHGVVPSVEKTKERTDSNDRS